MIRFRLDILALLLSLALAGIAACGDPTDDPEDCTVNEYFDDGSELCRTCPALQTPTCGADCGFFIVAEDDRPCPRARCLVPDAGGACVCPADEPECSATCGEGEVFDARSFSCLSCDVSCESGFDVTNGVCTCAS